MSTSLLYHTWGVRGYTYVRTDFVGGATCFHILPKAGSLRCTSCRSRRVRTRGHRERSFRGVPVGNRPVTIVASIPRLECLDCGRIAQAKVGFAEGKRRYTKGFERYVLDLSRLMNIEDVARHLGVSWNVVRDIQKRYLQRRYSRPRLKHLRLLGIDEISIGRGHRYLTVVLDMRSGAVVFVGDGKGSAALDPFWKRLRRFKAQIEAVAMDMAKGYINAVSQHLPNTTIVFDRFHVVKLVNDKLAQLRRDIQRNAEAEQKAVLKGSRWLLLKNPQNLDEERGEKERLQAALKLNAPLAAAYYLKEDLRQLWSQPDKKAAKKFLVDWCRRARSTGVRILQVLANTLQLHRAGILAWYDYPISNGPLEGTNAKIKLLQRTSYGYRNQDFFRLKIYALHETRHVLVG